MKIHHITRRFVRDSWGGTESAVLGMASQQRLRLHDAEILTSMALASARHEDFAGVPVHRFGHHYPYLGLSAAARLQLDMRAGNLFSFSLLTHLLATPPPDIYHLHTGKRLGGIVRSAARWHRRPYLVSLHGGVLDVPAAERARWTEPAAGAWEWGRALGAAVGARRVLQDASAILCVNRAEQQGLQQQFPGKRVVWTPNTVDVARYATGCGRRFRALHGVPVSAQVILNVGRIDDQKNQLAAVDIFDTLAAHNPDLWLIFAGASTNPGYADRLQYRIAHSVYAARIRCLRNVEAASQDLVDMYRAANVFLLTSLHEPFGIVLLEAWAAQVPVVAPRVGGIPSFVCHKRNGLLYDSGDLASATSDVRAVLASPELSCNLVDQASQDVMAFDTAQAAGALLNLYQEVIDESSVRP